MTVRLPMLPNGHDAEILKRCYKFAGDETAMQMEMVALVVSAFLERLTIEVSKGHVVRIPGFGIFVARPRRARYWRAGNQGRPVQVPEFSPSAGFRQMVRYCAPGNTEGELAIEQHLRNNSHRKSSADVAARATKTQQHFREQIRKQLDV